MWKSVQLMNQTFTEIVGQVRTSADSIVSMSKDIADGNTNEQMGALLTISPQTVRTHVQKAMEKLGATTRVQAVAIALRESLIS